MVRTILPSVALALSLLCACPPTPNTPAAGGGAGGADAGCPTGPTALLALHILADDGPVPPDTQLEVTWSAGDEPDFELDKPGTWGTAADGSNVICDVDPSQPPPKDLPELVCHLWTSGATHVKVTAAAHTPYEATLKPKTSADCDGPVPTRITVHLVPLAPPDAGAEAAP